MSRVSEFISTDQLKLSFPPTVATDEQRVLYALWRERAQSIERLCLHTGLPPFRIVRAVRGLALAGRLRVDPEVATWLDREEASDPDSERAWHSRSQSQLDDELSEERI